MADTAAFYGLLGALGGALLGAGAAITAPLLQTKNATRDRNRAEAEDEINRLIRVRSSTRAVVKLQRETVAALIDGHGVEVSEFASAMSGALDDLQDAADGVLLDGWLIPISEGSAVTLRRRFRRPRVPVPRRLLRDELHVYLTTNGLTNPFAMPLTALERLGDEIRRAAQAQTDGIPVEVIDSLRDQVAEAERLRGVLISEVLDRIERAQRKRSLR
ncbi:hypothetical protein [Streptomyces sp. KHY 26]|uniref:hypothetical protein n=1 Tax=Streptomyces sp. KHY 26 TaxID=3097359 RepID=UPI00376EED39